MLKIVFGYNSSSEGPTSAKFREMKQNGMLTKASKQKLPISKIQDG